MSWMDSSECANGIKHGAILMGIGSLRQLSFQVLTPKPETKLGAGYTEPSVTVPVSLAWG